MNAPLAHDNRQHARLGGSAASIFTVCTGAPALWAGRSRKATAFTREGTAAHEIADHALTHDKQSMIVGDKWVVEGETVDVDAEMLAAVNLYVDAVNALKAEADWYKIEQGFTLDALWSPRLAPEPMFGTADFVAVLGDLLVVLDLKYGKGVPVSAVGNAQLLFYALGVYFALLREQPTIAAEIKYVRMGIHQPRIKDEVEWWDVPVIDIVLWGENVLKRSVDHITAGQTHLKAGKHCQFCVAKPICPAIAEEAMQAAKGVFPPPAPVGLTDQELGEALERAEILNTWMQALRQEVEARINQGHPVPGWKLVAKKGYRQWTDEQAALAILSEQGMNTATRFMSDPELLSPAQVEKRLKQEGIDPKVVAPFIVAPVTGTTLVPETDKRPAVTTSPQSVFPEVND